MMPCDTTLISILLLTMWFIPCHCIWPLLRISTLMIHDSGFLTLVTWTPNRIEGFCCSCSLALWLDFNLTTYAKCDNPPWYSVHCSGCWRAQWRIRPACKGRWNNIEQSQWLPGYIILQGAEWFRPNLCNEDVLTLCLTIATNMSNDIYLLYQGSIYEGYDIPSWYPPCFLCWQPDRLRETTPTPTVLAILKAARVLR